MVGAMSLVAVISVRVTPYLDSDLSSANLTGADLNYANLTGADLTNAEITQEQLDQADTLQGATMPDG